MTFPLRRQSTFPGTLDGAAAAATWLRDIAADEQLSDKLAFALEVCLEELATNVVRHGGVGRFDEAEAGAGPPLSFGVGLVLEQDAVGLVIEDNGRPFDVSQAPARPIRKPLEDIVAGGLGMQLIRSFSDELHYEPTPGGNRVILKFLRQEEGQSRAEV